jgi:hypothetical protein
MFLAGVILWAEAVCLAMYHVNRSPLWLLARQFLMPSKEPRPSNLRYVGRRRGRATDKPPPTGPGGQTSQLAAGAPL